MIGQRIIIVVMPLFLCMRVFTPTSEVLLFFHMSQRMSWRGGLDKAGCSLTQERRHMEIEVGRCRRFLGGTFMFYPDNIINMASMVRPQETFSPSAQNPDSDSPVKRILSNRAQRNSQIHAVLV